jgi:redox-sensitive bicupin YhaK (pirin superfamily)
MRIRKSEERGHANHGWLDTFHTFSFAGYHDPAHMGYRALRVINEDVVAPGRGFGTHPHDNMEIVTYVLAGAVQHRDSMGNGSIIRPGEVQRMTAGTGVTHSELNPSPQEPLHLLQIWILPERRGLAPDYEQRAFPEAEKRGRLRLVASRDGRSGSVTIHQDVDLYAAVLEPGGAELAHAPADGRCAWVQVARGGVELNGESLSAGDGAALEPGETIRLRPGAEPAEVLVFDLA